MTSSGATARSWKSSTEKLARPTGAPSRLPSMRTGMTIAVEDMASAPPIVSAAAGFRPSAQAIAARTSIVSDDLREPESEHQPAHAPQALERQFEPHGEQERDDPEGGELVDRHRH